MFNSLPLVSGCTAEDGEPASSAHFQVHRRDVLRIAGLAGAAWMTPTSELLAGPAPDGGPANSIILLWMAGGPSQLETFDPHPGSSIAAGSKAVETRAPGLMLGDGLARLAERMDSVSLVRSLTSKEGDHQRGQFYMKTGERPTPAIEYPTLGAVVCHQTRDSSVELPRHVSILPGGARPAWGGVLGPRFDAFQTGDPLGKLPDVAPRVADARFARRLEGLDQIERAFAKSHGKLVEETRHNELLREARRMMDSEQLDAFDVSIESNEVRQKYGDTPFGRGCLAARRLVEAGVRCIEVTLPGWDSHINNHEVHAGLVDKLDKALSALLDDLQERDLLDRTVVLCGGEFGRTPRLNGLEGRDHWPYNFAWAVAGGGFAGGRALGETDPNGGQKPPKDACTVADLYATTLHALGIDPATEVYTPSERPIKLSEGRVLQKLLA